MSNRLPVLVVELRQAHADVLATTKVTAARAIDAGSMLIEAKELVAHGGWLPFLAEAGIQERSAQRYMRLAAGNLGSDTVSLLGGIVPALRFLSMRDDAQALLRQAEAAAVAQSTDEAELCDPIAQAIEIMYAMAAMFPPESLERWRA
jgi:hypothetical protein